ncbi:MAG: hypothetical protein ACR2LI_18080 [Propionibacteriaceae bacterium]
MSGHGLGSIIVGAHGDTRHYGAAFRFAAAEKYRRRTGMRLVHGSEPLNTHISFASRLSPDEQVANEQLRSCARDLEGLTDPDLPVECRTDPRQPGPAQTHTWLARRVTKASMSDDYRDLDVISGSAGELAGVVDSARIVAAP